MVTFCRLCCLLALAALAGCVSATRITRAASVPASTAAVPVSETVGSSVDASDNTRPAIQPDSAVIRAIEKRVAELKTRGGVCSSYAAVMESAHRSGQITIRPYMWRVGPHLTSGEAKPNGEMVLARNIDSLNVGLRTVDDLVRSIEHEAVHIALRLENDLVGDRADDYVRACRDKA